MNYKEKIDDVKKVAKKNLKTLLLDLGVCAVSLGFVFYNSLEMVKKDTFDPIDSIKQALLGIITGVAIKTLLGEIGFSKGYLSEEYTRAKKDYDDGAEIALPYSDHTDDFYQIEEKEKIEKNRRAKLTSVRLKYETFFDEMGNYKENLIITPERAYLKAKKKTGAYVKADNEIILNKKQIKMLDKCLNIKIYTYDLFAEFQSDVEADERKQTTDNDQRRNAFRKNLLGAIAFSLIGIYYVPQWKWEVGHIVMATFQVIGWVVLGIVQLYDNYNFIVIEKVKRLNVKRTRLVRFLKMAYDNDKDSRKDFIEKFGLGKREEKPQIEPPKQQEFIEVEMTEEELKKYKGAIN